MKSNLKILIACVVALFAGLYLQLFGFNLPERRIAVSDPEIEGLLWPNQKALGDFSLVGSDGGAYQLDNLRNRWSFVFFGYTHCPDICPITMQTLSQVRNNLDTSNIAAPVNYLFISVDGERDTPEHLSNYINYFGQEFEAASGSPSQVDSLATQIGVPYSIDEHAPGEDYLVAHSGAVYLVSPQGNLTAVFQPPHTPEDIASRFQRIQSYLDNRS